MRPLILPLLLLVPLTASGQQDREVVLLNQPGEADRSSALGLALEAHLAGLPVKLRRQAVEPVPYDAPPGTTPALPEGAALLVVWLSDDGATLMLMAPGHDEVPRARSIPDTGEGWASRCDAMATVVHSEVEFLLETPLPEPTPPEPEPPPPRDEPEPEPAPEEEPLSIGLRASAGYAPLILSGSGPYLNGAHFGVGVAIGPYVEIGVGFDLVQRHAFSAGERTIEQVDDDDEEDDDEDEPEQVAVELELSQWPIRPTVTGILPLGRLELGLAVGPVVQIWKLRGLAYDLDQADSAGTHVDWGFAPSFMARFRVWKLLAVWLELGVDLFASSTEIARDDEPVLVLGVARPRGAVGLVLMFEVPR